MIGSSFQMVKATGMTDTCPTIKGSELPEYATASPSTVNLPTSPKIDVTSPEAPPMDIVAEDSPLAENSKSRIFNQRMDYMISDFFTRVLKQRIKERLGPQWAHVTAQPEVDEAAASVQELWDYFESLEKMTVGMRDALQRLSDVESESASWYQQQAYHESLEMIRSSMSFISSSYQGQIKERVELIRSYDHYIEFLRTFRLKAIGDSLETIKKQQHARLELDAHGSKLGQMEEKRLKSFAKSPGLGTTSDSTVFERELEQVRLRFQEAKHNYQYLSTQTIDKAGMLLMKRSVDFAAHLDNIAGLYKSKALNK